MLEQNGTATATWSMRVCTMASLHLRSAKRKEKAFYSWVEAAPPAGAMEGKWDHTTNNEDISSASSTTSSCGQGKSSPSGSDTLQHAGPNYPER